MSSSEVEPNHDYLRAGTRFLARCGAVAVMAATLTEGLFIGEGAAWTPIARTEISQKMGVDVQQLPGDEIGYLQTHPVETMEMVKQGKLAAFPPNGE